MADQKLTPLQEYNLKQLEYAKGLSLRDVDTYGGYSKDKFGISTAAMLDPKVADWMSMWDGVEGMPQSVRDAAKAADDYYNTNGWDAVLEKARQQGISNAQSGYDMAMAHPEKKFSDGSWSTEDFLVPLALGGIVFGGGMALSGLLSGGAAGGAAAAGLGDIGLGSIPIDSSIGSLGWMDGALAASAPGAGTIGASGAGAAGLGSMAVDASIPSVVVNGSTAGGGGLSSVFGGSAGTAGTVLSAAELGNMATNLPDLTNVSSSGGSGSSMPKLPNGMGGLSDLLKGAGTIGSAVADYHMQNADKDYYQGLLDKMMGMYQPGTPEATLMEQKMNAQDAAAGRNSQYGTRATNLAGMLAQQRANIMTSPTFNSMAQASRGHYDNSLNSLFGALGQASTPGSSINNLINTGTNLYNSGSKLWDAGSSYLSNLFGGG